MSCLLCYQPLAKDEIDYHSRCVTAVFGLKQMPPIEIDEEQLTHYAKEILGANSAITGVQPKLSLWLEESKKNIRFTVINHKSNYIIKPQSESYPFLPENEDVCMHLAAEFGIETAKHGLVRLPSGSLAYITKRFERDGEQKFACEDLCQLTGLLTEHKYRGSYENTGKVIRQHSTQGGLDTLRYFELVVFSFVTGNADMHLKNFSMLEREEGTFCLSPAYDLVSTALVITNEPEQMSMTVNGRKNRILKKDFTSLGVNLLLNEKQIQNCYHSFLQKLVPALWWIEHSFLPPTQKEVLKQMMSSRIKLLND